MALGSVLKNTQVPLIINNRINDWPVSDYTEEDWCKLFGSRELEFRCGDFQFQSKPKWENTCRRSKMTLKDFFNKSKDCAKEWHYFDYKDMNTLFQKGEGIFDAFSWKNLGFPNLASEDSTLWIGNTGAHTPCHMDAHGFNLVAQLYGRKLWILASPENVDHFEPTRVPYEETTIYSSLNFFTPGKKVAKCLRASNAFKVILEPGEVLCVPRHWWHYVENLEPAISINTWIPKEEDVESQLDEALVQKCVEKFGLQIDEPVNDLILNHLAKKCLEFKKTETSTDCVNLENVCRLTSTTDWEKFVQEKSLKYDYDYEKNDSEETNTANMLINSFCHPETIKQVRKNFLTQFQNQNL